MVSLESVVRCLSQRSRRPACLLAGGGTQIFAMQEALRPPSGSANVTRASALSPLFSSCVGAPGVAGAASKGAVLLLPSLYPDKLPSLGGSEHALPEEAPSPGPHVPLAYHLGPRFSITRVKY
jgi:hypothetical protein